MSKSHEEAFRARLVAIVKQTARDVYDNAEDFVGTTDLMTDFDIHLHFSPSGIEAPTIEIVRTHFGRKACNVLLNTSVEDFMKDGDDQNIE